MSSETDPITSHVLDQTQGTPAEGMSMTLWLASTSSTSSPDQSAPDPALSSSPSSALVCFRATTASGSGRVSRWSRDTSSTGAPPSTPAAPETRMADVLKSLRDQGRPVSEWVLVLDTAAYWTAKGGKSFYPRVRIEFTVDQSEGRDHWHVPVLLGPFGYTTYRGT